MRGEGGVAGEGRVVSFMGCVHHAINEYQLRLSMSNTSSGLCITLHKIYYTGPLSCILGCNITYKSISGINAHLTVLCCFLFLVFMVGAACLIFANTILSSFKLLWLATESLKSFSCRPSLVV